jgi:hypothetical protein
MAGASDLLGHSSFEHGAWPLSRRQLRIKPVVVKLHEIGNRSLDLSQTTTTVPAGGKMCLNPRSPPGRQLTVR